MNATPLSPPRWLAAASASCLAALLALSGCPSDSTSPDAGGGTDTVTTDPGGGGGKDGAGGPDTGPNSPPELERIGDRIIGVGEALVIVVSAEDPDGDSLIYSIYGELPAEARFNKAERRFEWTPTKADTTVFLTFVVSDGEAFDRETVRIQVVVDKGAHPPEFKVVGDQSVTVGVPYTLTVVATDPDGDKPTYGSAGKLPQGATLDPKLGVFSWTPDAAQAGHTVRVTFTATDGALSAELEVTFVVTEAGGGGPQPPVFAKIGALDATVGQALSLTLAATDPNGDAVTFAIHDGAPTGSSLSGAAFTFTPTAGQAGQVFPVTFSATDGTFTVYETAEITVKKAAAATACSDDPGEPNGTVATATLLTPGTVDRSLCDTTLVPVDTDVYAVALAAGEQLTASITFDPLDGDLELYVVDAELAALASSEGSGATEEVTWASASATTVYVVVLGVGQETFQMGYKLTLAVATATVCTDDAFEDNDTESAAKPVPPAGTPLAICPGDVDWWKVDVQCGQDVTIGLDTGGSGDLDVAMWSPDVTNDTPVAKAATEAAIEVAILESAPLSGTYPISVAGWPAATESGTYTLNVAVDGGCTDDSVAGTSAANAPALTGETGSHAALTLCCAPDWFAVTLAAGDELLVDVSVNSGSAGVTVLAPGGTTQLASKPPSPGGAIAEITASQAGKHLVQVSGAVKASYSIEWLVTATGSGGACTPLSCPKFEVCGDDGTCVSDFCFSDDTCPTGHVCRDTYCVAPCAAPADCRAEYACKAFDAGQFCGITGSGAAGAPCTSHAACAASAVCTFMANGGYCAALRCLEDDIPCPTGTACTLDAAGDSLCGLSCASSADCRTADGYTCTAPEDTCLPQ